MFIRPVNIDWIKKPGNFDWIRVFNFDETSTIKVPYEHITFIFRLITLWSA